MSSVDSNPFSTGGGGQFFEAKVQASFLLNLLIGGRVPCLPSGRIQSVRLQAKQAGYDTDDVVVTILSSAAEHKLLAQVKHHMAITVSDGEFCDSLASAWSDFNNSSAFVWGQDAIALITGPQSDRTLQHVRPLLDWARTSATSAEFFDKVETARFSSDQKRAYLQVFKDVLAKVVGSGPPHDSLWQFLRHLFLLSYDFDMQESKDEAAVLTVLELARNSSGSLDAQAIWEGLIVQTQEWNKTAGTYTPTDFPERLRSSVLVSRSTQQQEAVSRLQEHCKFVLEAINTELAPGIRLSRSIVLDILAEAIEASRVVVVQGAPGSGKSAIVKMLIEALPNGIIPFAFEAQEFNHTHLHQFLTSIGVRLSMSQLRCEFSQLPRKLLLVDGAERLFEISSHEAFRHLISDMSSDESWTVIITCREASAQSLREHLLAQWDTGVNTVPIPTLSNEELEWVAGQAPQLASLIANRRLTNLLRIPFVLSLAWKAFSGSTTAGAVSEIDERQFKNIVWRDYVERSTQAQDGLPIKRGQCLISVSVERARHMSLFVSPGDRDPAALQALVDDSVLLKSAAGGFAPAHDILEDWAVSRFIAQEFETKAGDPVEFVDAVGTEPAMRRGFRQWLSEALAESDKDRVMDFTMSGFRHTDLDPVWRDEIAVEVLQSESAGEFISRLERQLLDGDKVLFKRLVHILRTACKGPNESMLRNFGLATFRSHEALGAVFVIPVGSGWRELILFTHRNLEAFSLQDADTVLSLLQDWAQGIGPSDPLPTEAQPVAQICLKYWGLLTAPDLWAKKMEQDFLKILFKIPHAAPDEVTSLIRTALAGELARNYHSRIVLEHVTKSFECQPFCQHLPDLVIDVAENTWKLKPKKEPYYSSRHDLEELFGLEHSVHFRFFPESSLQGPFSFLLSFHPNEAVDFIVRLANQAALSYSQSEIGDEVQTVQIQSVAGERPLMASPHLWALYRSMMPGPQVLECALMALEAWLLGQAKQNKDIREVFRKILNTSSSAATIAVLASVAVAYPEAVAEEVLPILRVREFFQWDLERSYQEHFHVTDMRSTLGIPSSGIEEIYYQERKDSAALPHRKSNLEELTFRLQWTSLRDEIHAILDASHEALPPENEQSKADKVWRIALHRMDARHFKAEADKDSKQIILTPGAPAPDLQQHIDKAAEDFAPTQRCWNLAMWGKNQFMRTPQSIDTFPNWRDALREARELRELQPAETDETSLNRSGPCFVAACLLRDHHSELDSFEMVWCRQLVIEEVLSRDAERTYDTQISKNPFKGSRPCALVLPLLLRGEEDSQARSRIEECIAVAVTHTSEEVRGYAAEGVRSWLWDIDAGLAKACVGGLVELAGSENQIRRIERSREGFSHEGVERAVLAATNAIRTRIVKRETSSVFEALTVDLETYDWPELLNALGMLKSDVPDPDLCTYVMGCLTAVLSEAESAEAWKSDDHEHYEFQYAFARLFARFALARTVAEAEQIGLLLRDYIDRCPKYLAVLLEALPYEEDRVHSDEVFWSIWEGVSEPIFGHSLLYGSSRIWRYDEMRKLVRILLFADVEWQEGVKEWKPVSSKKDFIETAATVVGITPAGFGAFVALLCSVGQILLPDAIMLLSDLVNRAEGKDLLVEPDASFQLEVLLRKVCYQHGTAIRQRPDLHRAVLLLLDRLVDRGSHSAFRLRDYIVSPLPAV